MKETRDRFDKIEHKAKEYLPNVDYKCVNKWKIIRKEKVNDADALNGNESFFPRDKFFSEILHPDD